jgi:AGZA family xanthine/uracil permease-like MFS transporter
MPSGISVKQNKYLWARPGDINAFFGLMLDNIAGLVLLVGILAGFGIPVNFSLSYMVPGTAIGVLVGDLLFFWLAFRYAKRSGKTDVTAMPLGLDTPSLIGMSLLVVGPAFLNGTKAVDDGGMGLSVEDACLKAWHIGMCSILIMGLIKTVFAFGSGWIHKVFPRAGLLGSLAAIALVLIAFMPLLELAASPIVGFASLIIVLVTLIGRQQLPFKIPGAFGSVMIGVALYYLLFGIQSATGSHWVESLGNLSDAPNLFPTKWMSAFTFEWLGSMGDTLPYVGYLVPFAIATVVGGIDCAESAKSAGDDYHTGTVIGVEAFATVLAALCGGVIQTTPYIGHPAYKAMGGRAAYTLATALFVGAAGLVGFVSYIFLLVPKVALLPILIFIGLEITAQSFHATARRHYAAIAVAFLPAFAKLVMIILEQLIGSGALDAAKGAAIVGPMTVLSGGFILTSLIWASATAKIIDRRYTTAAIYLAIGGLLTLFGLMHSPLPGDQMFWPWQMSDTSIFSSEQTKFVRDFAIAYLVMALLMLGLAALLKDDSKPIDTDEEFENLT